jgi:hypothetical protein
MLCTNSPGKNGPAIALALDAYIPAATIPEVFKKNLLCIVQLKIKKQNQKKY